MKLGRVIKALEALSPVHLAEPWDEVGLHVGDPKQPVARALLCIDLTEPVLDEAIAQKTNLVVAYHPPIFKPLSRLTTLELKQRIILRAARKGIAVYSPHTALDAAQGGVNDWLACGLGAGSVSTIKPAIKPGVSAECEQVKLAVFVPVNSAKAVRSALFDAGAGRLGAYSECSFSTEGQGTFKGDHSSNPTVGRPGKLERVQEDRLEMLVPQARLPGVIQALRQAHPYEEPAFDLYRLSPAPDVRTGQGRVVTLDQPATLSTLIRRIKKHLGVKALEVATPGAGAAGRGKVRRIGLCAGAGGSLLGDAGPVDVFFTGEMRHHDVLEAVGQGTCVILAGHTQTERPYLPIYRRHLAKETGKAVQWRVSRRDRPPSSPC